MTYVREHAGPLEADLLHHYPGTDLRRFGDGSGELTPRRFRVLVEHLPTGSAIHRVLFPESAPWDVAEYLLALIADQLAAANWQRANSGSKRPKAPPKPMWRPPLARGDRDRRIAEWKERHQPDPLPELPELPPPPELPELDPPAAAGADD